MEDIVWRQNLFHTIIMGIFIENHTTLWSEQQFIQVPFWTYPQISFDYCSASNVMEGFLVVTRRPEKVVGQNKGFSPPFDIFSPLVKATFQQFGTFLLMLMLLTRNSISFHFVLPPSHSERARGHHRSKPTTKLCPASAQADNLWMEILEEIHLFFFLAKGIREWNGDWIWLAKLGPLGIYGSTLVGQNNWNIPPQVDVFPQASLQKGSLFTQTTIFIHINPARLICLHLTPLVLSM